MRKKEIKEVTLFFVISIFLSLFVFWGPIAILKVPAMGFKSGAAGPIWAIIFFIIGGFVPSITGIILTIFFEGKKHAKQLVKAAFQVKISFKWFTAIVLIASYYAVSCIILYSALGGHFKYTKFLTLLPTILPLFLLGPLSEEYGWRGFALKRLLKIVNPNLASLILGLVWSLWHLPLFYMLGINQYEYHLSFLTFIISVTSMCFVYTYIYIRTNQNLFTAVLFHWVYTFLSDVVNSGIVRSSLYNILEFAPSLLLGIVFAFMLYRSQVEVSTANAGNKLRLQSPEK